MKAVRIHKFGGGPQDLVYENVSLPIPKDDEVVVKVYATGVTLNGIVWIWKNQNITLPIILGHELSGVVSEVGFSVTDLRFGEAVFGLTDSTIPMRGGTEAEYAVAKALDLASKPDSLGHTFAAEVSINGRTYPMASIVRSWPIVLTRYHTYSWGWWSCR